jgi:hypothetical protein
MIRRHASRPVRALAAACLVAHAAAGCGGEGGDHGTQVSKVQGKYRDSITPEVTSGAALLATDPSGAQMRLAHAAADAHRLAEEIAALQPPAGKKGQAVRLANAYRSLAASLDALAGATRTADAGSLQTILAQLRKAQADEQGAVTALNG